jgi:hypothetical protein
MTREPDVSSDVEKDTPPPPTRPHEEISKRTTINRKKDKLTPFDLEIMFYPPVINI